MVFLATQSSLAANEVLSSRVHFDAEVILSLHKEMYQKGANQVWHCFIYEPRPEKTCLMPYANNKDAYQPVHPRSLISAFVVRWLDSITSLVAISEMSRLWLATVV